MWDYTLISELVSRGVAGSRTLSPATLVLCLSALSKMENDFNWDNVTTAEFDEIEAWVAGAYLDLMTPISVDTAMKTAYLKYYEADGTDGTDLYQNVETSLPLTAEVDPYSLVEIVSAYGFTLEAGLYELDAIINVRDAGRFRGYLKHSSVYDVYSNNGDNEDNHLHIKGLFECEGSETYFFKVETNQTGAQMGRKTSAYGNERYGTIALRRLGDIPT